MEEACSSMRPAQARASGEDRPGVRLMRHVAVEMGADGHGAVRIGGAQREVGARVHVLARPIRAAVRHDGVDGAAEGAVRVGLRGQMWPLSRWVCIDQAGPDLAAIGEGPSAPVPAARGRRSGRLRCEGRGVEGPRHRRVRLVPPRPGRPARARRAARSWRRCRRCLPQGSHGSAHRVLPPHRALVPVAQQQVREQREKPGRSRCRSRRSGSARRTCAGC